MEATSTYTVTHAIDSLGFGRFQILLSLAMGFANVADAMEMMILSILAPALQCAWGITQVEQATITTVVFLGMFLSAVFWGMVADKYGRRPTLIITSAFLCYFGFLTSFAPSYGWVVFIRFLVGFYIGGIPQSCTLYAEFLPTAVRGRAIMVMSFFWAIGACLEALLAWAIMPNLGWRYLVGVSVIPLLIFLFFSPIIPESLLYLSVSGQQKRAEHLIARIARINGKKPLPGKLELVVEQAASDRGRVQDMLKPERRTLTLMVWFLWFVAAATYYGFVLLTTELLNSNSGVCQGAATEMTISATSAETECSLHQCSGLTSENYVEIVWTTFAEFPGTIIAILLIDYLGRRRTMAICTLSFSVATLIIMACGYSRTLLIIVLFIARGMSSAFFQAVYVYTPEAYPTNLRAVALGSGSASARIGAMITPYVAQVLLKQSLYATVGVYAGIGFLATFVSWFLPVETVGVSLADTGKVAFRHKRLTNEDEDDYEDEADEQVIHPYSEAQGLNRAYQRF